MLTCYLDEAGGKAEGFTVICGWVSTVAQWEQFEIDWRLFLASYKVPYFHMKEFAQSTGPFKKWSDARLLKGPKGHREFVMTQSHGSVLGGSATSNPEAGAVAIRFEEYGIASRPPIPSPPASTH